jgi:hypothetical protein
VRCTVVRDTVSEHGRPLERTFDWYAQDEHGNVWYMGEDSLELRHGRFVRASDSWQSGVKGAKPGIIMRGNPQPGEVYRQEYYPPGGAFDQARVLTGSASVKVPYGAFTRSLPSPSSGARSSRSWSKSPTSPESVKSPSASPRAGTSASSLSA